MGKDLIAGGKTAARLYLLNHYVPTPRPKSDPIGSGADFWMGRKMHVPTALRRGGEIYLFVRVRVDPLPAKQLIALMVRLRPPSETTHGPPRRSIQHQLIYAVVLPTAIAVALSCAVSVVLRGAPRDNEQRFARSPPSSRKTVPPRSRSPTQRMRRGCYIHSMVKAR